MGHTEMEPEQRPGTHFLDYLPVGFGGASEFGAEGDVGGRVAGVEDGHQVGDVGRSQSQRFDFGQLGVGRHVGDAVAQFGEGIVDRLRPAALLLVGRVATFHHPHSRTHRTNRTCTTFPRLLISLFW